jgi:hypothetical protein
MESASSYIWQGVNLVILVVGLLGLYFGPITKMKEDIAAIKVKVDLYWKGIEDLVIERLKSYPSNIDKDVLLDKFKQREINLSEALTLRTILKEELRLNGDPAKEFAYVLALPLLETHIDELKRRGN